jgi:hypothetical protein
MLVKNEQILAFHPKFPHTSFETSFETLGKLVKQNRFQEGVQGQGGSSAVAETTGGDPDRNRAGFGQKEGNWVYTPSA